MVKIVRFKLGAGKAKDVELSCAMCVFFVIDVVFLPQYV